MAPKKHKIKFEQHKLQYFLLVATMNPEFDAGDLRDFFVMKQFLASILAFNLRGHQIKTINHL